MQRQCRLGCAGGAVEGDEVLGAEVLGCSEDEVHLAGRRVDGDPLDDRHGPDIGDGDPALAAQKHLGGGLPANRGRAIPQQARIGREDLGGDPLRGNLSGGVVRHAGEEEMAGRGVYASD